jgi:hypothetical protein
MSKKQPPTDSRSAVTGRFVTPQYAETHPRTTVTEHRTKPANPGKKK